MSDIPPSPRQIDLEADFAAPRGMMLPIDRVHPSPSNLRRSAAGDHQDDMIRGSVATAGIYTPILVRPLASGDAYEVIDGHRRLHAARLAGMAHVPVTVRASNDAEQMAIQAAANIVRAPLQAVDQWEAMRRLQDLGYSIEDAAHTLGLPERFARRLSLLGQLHPDILAEIRKDKLPQEHLLATIANAPLKTQAAAIKSPKSWMGRGEDRQLSWFDLSTACLTQRLPRSRAIFDIDKAKVPWTEDLFAEPGAPDQFTTTDAAGFMKAQTAALAKQAEASKGKIQIAEWKEQAHGIALPKGWVPYSMGPKPKGLVTFKAIRLSGSAIGVVMEQQAAPKPKPEKKAPAKAGQVPPADAAEDDATDMPPAPAGRGTMTQAGLELLAKAQTEALRARIRAIAPKLDESELLELLLLTICADNVVVHGESHRYGRTNFPDVVSALMDENGAQRDMDPGQGRILAAEVIARTVIVTPRGGQHGSGAPAHWLGRWIEAHKAMPRLDTPEFLATLSLDALRVEAMRAGIKTTGTAKALREQLAGNAPGLTLPEAAFSASGPQPRTQSQEDGDDA